MKHATKKKVESDDEEDSSGDIDDDNDDSASESEDDDSDGEDGSDGAGSDDSEEAPKKRKAPVKKHVVAKKSARVKRPADAPKRPMSAYMIFCSEKRDQLRQSMPSATFVGSSRKNMFPRHCIDFSDSHFGILEIAKSLGETWMKMAPEEKLVYQQKAAEATEQYQKAVAAYEGAQETKLPLFDSKEDKKPEKKTPLKKQKDSDDDDNESSEEAPRKFKKKDPSAPKRPMSACTFPYSVSVCVNPPD
jgi:hypothetical protein